MTDRTLDEAMGMTRAEIAQMRAKVDRLAQPLRCDKVVTGTGVGLVLDPHGHAGGDPELEETLVMGHHVDPATLGAREDVTPQLIGVGAGTENDDLACVVKLHDGERAS